ncbi:MAG: GGDEF domain-containing protein [Deltaproteobacteria bacterium]|nr:GGDEF domain-containing protein [Deltaproteobacteria bacterium]
MQGRRGKPRPDAVLRCTRKGAATRQRRRWAFFSNLLDDFGLLNNERGHAEGDRALTTVAEVLTCQVRASDLVARLGGDEFAILMHDTGPDAARTSLERIRNLVAAAMRREKWPVAVSIGAVAYARAPSTVREAIRGADSVMYRAKRGGKNSVQIEVVESGMGAGIVGVPE